MTEFQWLEIILIALIFSIGIFAMIWLIVYWPSNHNHHHHRR